MPTYKQKCWRNQEAFPGKLWWVADSQQKSWGMAAQAKHDQWEGVGACALCKLVTFSYRTWLKKVDKAQLDDYWFAEALFSTQMSFSPYFLCCLSSPCFLDPLWTVVAYDSARCMLNGDNSIVTVSTQQLFTSSHWKHRLTPQVSSLQKVIKQSQSD